MFQRISNGWELTKESFGVLRMDKELLVFPLISGISCLLVLVSFFLPLWVSGYGGVLLDSENLHSDPVAYAILFAFYTVNYFVIVFFNSALVACAIIRFKGGDPTLSDGLRAASNRFPQILAWALVSATVGVILRLIESWSEKAGQFVAALLGGAWSLMTFFVVPLIVVEKVGPVDAVKRSFSILQRTWGEALTANFGIGFIKFMGVLVLGIIPLVAGGFIAGNGYMAPGIILAVCGVAGIILTTLVGAAVDSIVLAAFYLYAAEGKVPSHINDGLLKEAFARK